MENYIVIIENIFGHYNGDEMTKEISTHEKIYKFSSVDKLVDYLEERFDLCFNYKRLYQETKDIVEIFNDLSFLEMVVDGNGNPEYSDDPKFVIYSYLTFYKLMDLND